MNKINKQGRPLEHSPSALAAILQLCTMLEGADACGCVSGAMTDRVRLTPLAHLPLLLLVMLVSLVSNPEGM